MKTKAKPTHQIRFGAVKAAIWENQSQGGTRYNVTLMEDDGYWKDVEKAYHDCLMEGMTLPEDKLWAFAKKRTGHRYFLQRVKERAIREGLDFDTLLRQENALRREAERKQEECRLEQQMN